MKKTWLIIIALIIVIICVLGVQMCIKGGFFTAPEVTSTPVPSAVNTPTSTPDDVKKVTLYFVDSNAEYLLPEERSVRADDINSLALATLNELIKGSANNHGASINPDTKINGVKVENGVCYIDFKSDFENKNTGGSAKESFFIYSIVNTLTEFDTVNEVKLLSDGEPVTEFGHFILDEPLVRDEKMIKK